MLDLDYTGHPIFDVGLAALVACAEKEYPTDLTEEDLGKAATFIEDHYTHQPLTSFLTTSLMNSDFTQPAFEKKPERRLAYARLVARSFGENVPQSAEICVFTGKPALGVALSLKVDKEGHAELPVGRAFRQHIPLVTGEGIINFSPWGDHGLPVSGEALLCLQFFPMGCSKCSGRLLAVHSDNPDLLLQAARRAWYQNEKEISLALSTHATKLPDAASSASALIIETILTFTQKQERVLAKRQPYSVTAYHLTNSGQSSALDEKSPPLTMYHLPMNLIGFLQLASHPDQKRSWNRLVARGWERPKPMKKAQAHVVAPQPQRRRNFFYDDLLRLPENAPQFARRHFWFINDVHAAQHDPQTMVAHDERGPRDKPFLPWSFIAVFLREVLSMDKERIEQIKTLGDGLAAYVKAFDDQRFFTGLYNEQRPDLFRSVILRAARVAASNKAEPLFRYDVFCTVFFTQDGDDLRFDWKFARDLLCLRMLEWLYDHDAKVDARVNALPEERETETFVSRTANAEE